MIIAGRMRPTLLDKLFAPVTVLPGIGPQLGRLIERAAVPGRADQAPEEDRAARSTEEEKQSQLKRLAEFHARNAKTAPTMPRALRPTPSRGSRSTRSGVATARSGRVSVRR